MCLFTRKYRYKYVIPVLNVGRVARRNHPTDRPLEVSPRDRPGEEAEEEDKVFCRAEQVRVGTWLGETRG